MNIFIDSQLEFLLLKFSPDEYNLLDEDAPPFIAVLGDKYEGRCAMVEKAIIVSQWH